MSDEIRVENVQSKSSLDGDAARSEAIEQHEDALSMFARDFAGWPREAMITFEMIDFHHGYHHDSCYYMSI